MSAIWVNSDAADIERRDWLFDGAIFYFTPRAPVAAMTAHAWDLITPAFEGFDPVSAQDAMAVEQFVERVAPLKPNFTHSQRSKELLRDLLQEFGCDLVQGYHFSRPVPASALEMLL